VVGVNDLIIIIINVVGGAAGFILGGGMSSPKHSKNQPCG
jgi:hypothetical protein